MKQYGFGVDIGGTTCKIGLFEMNGRFLEKWEIHTNTENGGAAILDDVAEAVLGKMRQKKLTDADVQGIGLGVPGPVGRDGTVFRCVNLGWDVINVEKELGEKTGLYVKAGNDANVAALGEMWQGGGHGCLEQYASATGIVRLAKERLASGDSKSELSSVEELTAKAVFDAAREGDETAKELVDELCTMLGTALANIAAVVDPEIFVIGGGVSRAGEILIDGIRKHYVEKAFHACRATEIALATLGNDAGMYGCVRLLF